MRLLDAAIIAGLLAPAPALALDLRCQFGSGPSAVYREYSLSDTREQAGVRVDGRWYPASQAYDADGSRMATAIAILGRGRVEAMSAARNGDAYLTVHSYQENGRFSKTLTGRCD